MLNVFTIAPVTRGWLQKKSQPSSITAFLVVAAVMWPMSPNSRTLGVGRYFPHMAYDIDPADGNKRSPNDRITVPARIRKSGESAPVGSLFPSLFSLRQR